MVTGRIALTATKIPFTYDMASSAWNHYMGLVIIGLNGRGGAAVAVVVAVKTAKREYPWEEI